MVVMQLISRNFKNKYEARQENFWTKCFAEKQHFPNRWQKYYCPDSNNVTIPNNYNNMVVNNVEDFN